MLPPRATLRPVVLLACLVALPFGTLQGRQVTHQPEQMGPFLDSLMAVHQVPGVSFALFDRTGVIYEYTAGLKEAGRRDEITPRTAFEAASISKPVFGAIVIRLAADGVLSLDEPIQPIPEDLAALAADPRSGALTPRLLLTHMGGLPNWRARMSFEATSYPEMFSPDEVLEFVRDPGSEYGYSGEGYILLQRFVEGRTGRSLNELAKELVFEPAGMGRSSFRYDEAMREDAAMGHNRDGEADKWLLGLALASSTLHTTGGDLGRLGAMMARETEPGESLELLVSGEAHVGSRGTTSVDWGLGLGVVSDPEPRFFFHGGNNVIFIADFIYDRSLDLGYALLTNSAHGGGMVEPLELRVFGRDVVR